MNLDIPSGFKFAGVKCGIKHDHSKHDLSLIVSTDRCTAAGVYTQNRVVAAPVTLDRNRTPSDDIRAIVINSGNANACTGDRGMADARRMTELVASALNAEPSQVLVLSTGIIGEHLPMDRVEAGIRAAAGDLEASEDHVVAAAKGMMTTDTHHKVISRPVMIGSRRYSLLGLCKGAAMIGPRMATMLGVVMTDAPLAPEDAQRLLREAVEQSFNCISVEGHMSTNDTVLLLATSPAAGSVLTGAELDQFRRELDALCIALARQIPDDGEGATHLIEIVVSGCATRDEARQIARAVADSALVKTAIAGADPNWGRIVSAAGYSGVDFDPSQIALAVNGIPLFQAGQPLPFDEAEASESIRSQRLTRIELSLSLGPESIRFWTCDLTAEYVRLNADYHT